MTVHVDLRARGLSVVTGWIRRLGRRGAVRRTAGDPARAYLSELATELQVRGWRAGFCGDGWLLVANPAMEHDLRAPVGCRPTSDGGWEYCWLWGDPIGPVESLTDVADRIVRVLRVPVAES